METREVTRRDVEAKLASVGDYVKMDYLSQCLRKNLDFDTRKFVLGKLSSIYEQKLMFGEAGKLMANAAEINATFDGKVNDYIKAADLFIKGGAYDESETAFAKALASGSELQKKKIKATRRDMYIKNALDLMKKDNKRKNAMVAFEKVLNLNIELSPIEKKQYQQTLLGLYEKLGRIREFYNLQRSLSTNTVMGTQKVESTPKSASLRNANFRDQPNPPRRPASPSSDLSGDDVDISIDDLIGS